MDKSNPGKEIPYLSELFHEAVNEACEDVARIADLLCVFTNNPYQ